MTNDPKSKDQNVPEGFNSFGVQNSSNSGGISPTPQQNNDSKPALSGFAVKPRANPKGTMLIAQSDDEVVMRVRYVLQFWWPWLPLGMLAFTIFAAAPVGAFFGILVSTRFENYALQGATILVIVSAIGTWMAFANTRGDVTVVARKDKIQFGDKIFDRAHYGGMRTGYSVESDDGALKNDFFDQQMGFTALRLTYGRWGEDLPYLVNKYHAAEIVIWMSELIASVGAPPPKNIDASKGLRGQLF